MRLARKQTVGKEEQVQCGAGRVMAAPTPELDCIRPILVLH